MIDFSPLLDVHTAYKLLSRPERLRRHTGEFLPSAMSTLLDLDLHLYEWHDTDAFGNRIRGTDEARIEVREAGAEPNPYLGGSGLVSSLFCAKGLRAAASKTMRGRAPAPDREVWLIAQALARPLFANQAMSQEPSALANRITAAMERRQVGIAAELREGNAIASFQTESRTRL